MHPSDNNRNEKEKFKNTAENVGASGGDGKKSFLKSMLKSCR